MVRQKVKREQPSGPGGAAACNPAVTEFTTYTPYSPTELWESQGRHGPWPSKSSYTHPKPAPSNLTGGGAKVPSRRGQAGTAGPMRNCSYIGPLLMYKDFRPWLTPALTAALFTGTQSSSPDQQSALMVSGDDCEVESCLLTAGYR